MEAASPSSSRKKRRNLMEYYGEQEKKPIEDLSTRRPDPLDLDHPAFNAELYLNKYLYEVSLPDLIHRDNDLVTEIKTLDGDMKTLVYENYSKFISATDTIKEMRLKVDSMDSQVNKLAACVDKLDMRTTAINSSLLEDRKKIQQLSGVHNLLKKLNFVFELPDKLGACYKRKDYEQAVRYYAKTSSLLSHYGHLTMFKKIVDESRAIMNNVSKRVQERLVDKSSSLAVIASCIGMLCGLGNHKAEELAKLYISMQKIVETAQEIFNPPPLNKSMSRTSTPVGRRLSNPPPHDADILVLNMEKLNVILVNLATFTTSFDEFFPFSQEQSPSASPLKAGFKLFLNDQEYETIHSLLSIFCNQILNSYFGLVERLLKVSPDDILKVTASHNAVFKLILETKNNSSFNALDSHLQIHKRCSNFVDENLTRLVEYAFLKVSNDYFNFVAGIPVESMQDLVKTVEDLDAVLLSSHKQCKTFLQVRDLLTAKKFADTEESKAKVANALDEFWPNLYSRMQSLSRRPFPTNYKLEVSMILLILSKSAAIHSLSTIESVYRLYGEAMFGLQPEITSPKTKKEEKVHKIISTARKVSSLGKSASQTLLCRFVRVLSNEFTTQLCKSMQETDWINNPQPCQFWTDYFGKLNSSLDPCITQLFPDDGTISNKKKTHSSKKSPRQYDMLMSGIDKLFAEKVEIYSSVVATRGGILLSLLKILIKVFFMIYPVLH